MKRIADIHGAIIDGSSEIRIHTVVDDDAEETYFIFEEIVDFHPESYIRVYKDPDVNPRIFSLIDLIEWYCDGERFEDNLIKAPHLQRNGNIYHIDAADLIGAVLDDFSDPVLPASAPIPNQEFYDTRIIIARAPDTPPRS
jgi:hypothetical protein